MLFRYRKIPSKITASCGEMINYKIYIGTLDIAVAFYNNVSVNKIMPKNTLSIFRIVGAFFLFAGLASAQKPIGSSK
jgi:hypothetical protein